MKTDTIAAISTPIGQGGIAGIRLSGKEAIKIAENIFVPMSTKKSLQNMQGYTAAYGALIDTFNENIEYDNAICLIFKAPKSYTGEDVVEIFCHGGIYVAEKTLILLLKSGAVPAAAGEFTKRAFLNGKMSLTQAEAVMDVITAKNDNALQMAMSTSDGKLLSEIESITQKLIDLSAFFGAWFDYPEEGEEMKTKEDIINILKSTQNTFEKLIENYHQGKLIKEGIPTVIAGKPNVGKSTLMNLLAKEKRSIVTDIAGTTRDVIEETIRLQNVILRLSDTAGIRKTDDEIEKIGVEITLEKINSSSLILAVFDATEELTIEDEDFIKSIGDKKTIAIVNKIDVKDSFNISTKILEDNFENIIYISAKNNIGIEDLEKKILNILSLTNFDPMAGILSNKRQLSNILNAKIFIDEAYNALMDGITWDMISLQVELAIAELLELSGKSVNEEIINNIFDNFCVGK